LYYPRGGILVLPIGGNFCITLRGICITQKGVYFCISLTHAGCSFVLVVPKWGELLSPGKGYFSFSTTHMGVYCSSVECPFKGGSQVVVFPLKGVFDSWLLPIGGGNHRGNFFLDVRKGSQLGNLPPLRG
jgi:hypothetical protein